MFKSDQEKTIEGNPETFIGPSVRVQGDFVGEGNVTVEGIVTGNMQTKGDVTIGSQAVIEAELKAQNAVIAGKIKGNITIADYLQIRSTAEITGDIKTNSLAVENGAALNGKIIMSKDKVQKAFAADSERPSLDDKTDMPTTAREKHRGLNKK